MPLSMEEFRFRTDARLNWVEDEVVHVRQSIDRFADSSAGRMQLQEPLIHLLTRCVRTLDQQLRNSAVLMAQVVDCLSCPMKDACEVKFNKFDNMGNFDTCADMLFTYMLGGNESVLETLES